MRVGNATWPEHLTKTRSQIFCKNDTREDVERGTKVAPCRCHNVMCVLFFLPPSLLPYLPLSTVLRIMTMSTKTCASVKPSCTALKIGFSWSGGIVRGRTGRRSGSKMIALARPLFASLGPALSRAIRRFDAS